MNYTFNNRSNGFSEESEGTLIPRVNFTDSVVPVGCNMIEIVNNVIDIIFFPFRWDNSQERRVVNDPSICFVICAGRIAIIRPYTRQVQSGFVEVDGILLEWEIVSKT
tara:strand:+ start:171 stop:494 length:324 start_codon:yes stop_codon:yes gene_type:complete